MIDPYGRRALLIALYSVQLHYKTHDLVRNGMQVRASLARSRAHPFRHLKGVSGSSGFDIRSSIGFHRTHVVFIRTTPCPGTLFATPG
ncbi:hypothetical protein F3J17_07230 [Burkholderia sp. Ax-1719]|nr:hypothetical protein [Burkholderia sp. Ax-1719]